MINEKYKIAFSETLHYLKGINENDINKISKNFIVFLNNNCSKEYKCSFDYTKPLKDLELTNETKGIISVICLNYWCETEDQKKQFINHLNNNERIYQEKARKLYNPDNLFKNNNSNQEKNYTSTEITKCKESLFKRIINYIKNILGFK